MLSHPRLIGDGKSLDVGQVSFHGISLICRSFHLIPMVSFMFFLNPLAFSTCSWDINSESLDMTITFDLLEVLPSHPFPELSRLSQLLHWGNVWRACDAKQIRRRRLSKCGRGMASISPCNSAAKKALDNARLKVFGKKNPGVLFSLSNQGAVHSWHGENLDFFMIFHDSSRRSLPRLALFASHCAANVAPFWPPSWSFYIRYFVQDRGPWWLRTDWRSIEIFIKYIWSPFCRKFQEFCKVSH